jgi:serine/threonine-protein kinase
MAGRSKNLSFSFSDAEMPVRFGRYMLLRRKSVEAAGENFLALWGVDEGMDQKRVVRAIYPAAAEDEGFVAMFTEESRSLSQLASSNVVKVLEVGTERSVPFVAQEHVEGITVERLLVLAEERRTRCHWEIAVHIAAEMLRGLDYVHRREDVRGIPLNMHHGDVRPQNVLVSFNGEVKLTNFSSSLYYMVNEATNLKFETERGIYALPDKNLPAPKGATVLGDLWGVSVTLLVLLEGFSALKHIKAFAANGDSLTSVAYRIREVPKRINLLLARALHPDARHRFDSAASMRDTLLEIVKESGAGHPPDDLAAFVKDLGAADRAEEEQFFRRMLGRDASMSLDDSQDLGKISPGVVLDGKYQLLRLLGEGGMGQVFEAEHLGIEKRVAVKVLHERVLHDQVAVERFRREAKIMGGLGHPNIVGVSDYGVTAEGNYYLVMELLDGGSLGAKIADRGSISPEEIVDIMIPVCQGLTAAHAAEVVHRDLKPDNIFLTHKGPRIVDFGIAKRADMEDRESSLTKTGNICGTVEYISPEQLGGQPTDHRVDIYTAGLIIYEALTGVTPFKGRNIAETMNRIMSDKVVSPRKRTGNANIPRMLEEVCLKAMAREPGKRFQTAEEMRCALERIRSATRPSHITGTEFIAPQPKVRTVGVLLSLSAAMLVLAAVIYFTRRPAEEDFTSGEDRTPSAAALSSSNQKESASSLPSAENEKPVLKDIAEPTTTHPGDPSAKIVDTEEKSSKIPPPEPLKNPDVPAKTAAMEVEDHLKLGEKFIAVGDFDNAARHFETAARLDPRESRAWFGLGRTAFEQSNSAKAVTMIQKALKLDPGRYKWRIFLGTVYISSGNRDQAVKEWERVLATRPENKEAKDRLKKAGKEIP